MLRIISIIKMHLQRFCCDGVLTYQEQQVQRQVQQKNRGLAEGLTEKPGIKEKANAMKNMLSQKVRDLLRRLLQLPFVSWLRKRYPRPFYFLLYRFSTTSFIGLPLTLLLGVFLLNSLLLSQLAEEVMESDGVIGFDTEFTSSLFSMRSEWLSKALFYITHMGGRTSVFVVGSIVTAFFLYRRRYTAILAFWLIAAGAGISVRYGKNFISRDRPAEVAYYQEQFFSFPSGHATTAAAIYGFVGYLLFRHFHKRRHRTIILWSISTLIALIGFSRIYLGVHFLTDVLAGFMLGSMWMLIGISLMEVIIYRKAIREPMQQPKS